MDNARNNSRGQAPGAGSPKNKKKKRSVGRIIGKIFLTLFTLCVIGVLTFYLFFQIFMQYVNTTVVPDVGVTVEELTMSEASIIYVQDNATGEWVEYETLYSRDGNRRIIEYSDLPDHLVQALVDIEDHRFWEHNGVDWYSTASAMIRAGAPGAGPPSPSSSCGPLRTTRTSPSSGRSGRSSGPWSLRRATPRRRSSPSTSTASPSASSSTASPPPPRATSARTSAS